MLRRKIEQEMLRWKRLPNHNPLIIKGPRQCGKTYSVTQFGNDNYKHVVSLNFLQNPNYKAIFAGSLEVDDLVMLMTTVLGPDANFLAGETLIILDEIQECPEARTALKFFKLDGRFDVICTGSLLGVSGYTDIPRSIPVGYETTIKMYPLDFEEFLWANGIPPKAIEVLRKNLESETPIPEALHNKYRDLLLQYTVVGGMPAVVQTFITTKQMNVVLQMQRDIVNAYRDDMVKYASKSDKSKIRECFDSIPMQLAKENKKFQYAKIRKGSTASDYLGSIQWVEDVGIVSRCYNLSIPELPLEGNAIQESFKLYMHDTGLFVSMLEDGTQFDILQGNLYGYKGAIFQNLVADFFSKMGRALYYFRKDSGLEVDFVIRYKAASVLVEVKAESGNTKSTRTILSNPEKYHVANAIKLGNYNVGRSEKILTLPLYMGFLLENDEVGKL